MEALILHGAVLDFGALKTWLAPGFLKDRLTLATLWLAFDILEYVLN